MDAKALALRIAALEAEIADLRRHAAALLGDAAFGMPDGFAEVGRAYESAMGALLPATLGEWVRQKLADGMTVRHRVDGLREARAAFGDGRISRVPLEWKFLVEDTPVGERPRLRRRTHEGQRRDGSLTPDAVLAMAEKAGREAQASPAGKTLDGRLLQGEDA